MHDRIRRLVQELARRAGMTGVSPGAVYACVALAALALAWAGWRWWPRDAASDRTGIVASAAAPIAAPAATNAALEDPARGPTGGSDPASATVVVHVAGEVRRPGVYELGEGSRVVDALEAAGGTVGDAATDALNLARRLADGEQVFVPKAGEQPPAAAGQSGGAGGGGADSAKVNINAADAAALDTLPGVGTSTAEKIIAEREANGPFSSVEDLGRVSGIGPKRIEQLRDLVSVR